MAAWYQMTVKNWSSALFPMLIGLGVGCGMRGRVLTGPPYPPGPPVLSPPGSPGPPGYTALHAHETPKLYIMLYMAHATQLCKITCRVYMQKRVCIHRNHALSVPPQSMVSGNQETCTSSHID